MKKKTVGLVLVSCFSYLLLSPALVISAEEFSQERALAHLKVLAGTIGPRPLGSPQEKAALTYFAERLAEFGCRVEWQPVSGAKEKLGADALNTASFNVIGRLPGETEREIIIGAHIDSSTPEVPGADDDGSGVATILEAARVLAAEAHQSTLVFVAFCGEEAGLIGSKSFVENYPLKNAALMLQLDMTSDEAPLMLWIDRKKEQSPAWLVSSSIQAFHRLGYRNISYPTIFQSLNGSLGGAGSDHEPFLEKGIPAIGFVSDVRHPIHTPNDSLEYFKPDGLTRSGKLILDLVRKFDGGVPDKKLGRYMLVLVGERPLFIPLSLLAGFVFLSLVVGFAALLLLFGKRKAGVVREDDKKIKKSWPKLLILELLMLIVTFSSLWVMAAVTGYRIPWILHPGLYILYAFLFLIFGLWLSLQVLRRWRLRRNAYFYFVRAFIYFVFLIAASWVLAGPRLALFPAAGLLLIGLAGLAQRSWIKALLWLLSPYLIFRLLILPEYHEFVYRSVGGMGLAGVKTTAALLLVHLVLILFFILWTMPFLLGFAAVYRSSGIDLFGLKGFRGPLALIPIGLLIIGGALYLGTLPSYDKTWAQRVAVTQKYDAGKNETSVEFSSGDYLRGMTATIDGQSESIDARDCYLEKTIPFEMNWLRTEFSAPVEARGSERLVDLKLRLILERQPYAVELRLKSNRPFRLEEANVNVRHRKNRAAVRWFSFPPQTLEPEMKLVLAAGGTLEAEISATFLETPLAIAAAGKNKTFVHRAEIVRKLNLLESIR